MLESTRHNYKLTAILLSTICAGIPLWGAESRQIDFTDAGFLSIWIAIGIVASFVVRFVANLKMRDMIESFAIGYVLALVIHFVGTILISNYVQARFELSLLIAILSGIASSWIGSLIWIGIKRSGRKKK